MAKIKFKTGKEVHIPDQFIEPGLDPVETIPKEIQKGTLFRIALLGVTVDGDKEKADYLEYIENGGELISFSRFILLRHYTPTPLHHST